MILIRLASILATLARHGLRSTARVGGRLVRRSKPERLCAMFEDLGGVFLKFGQILSMRFDIIPMEYSLALLNLLDNAKRVPNEDMFAVFEREFKVPIHSIFELEETPLGVASFAQVYKGRYEGKDIVIKIQKPDARNFIETDLSLFSFFAGIGGSLGLLRAVSVRDVVKQLRAWLREELDYRIEAANMKEIYEHVKRHRIEREVIIPRLYEEFTTERVIVQEFLPGVQVSRLIGASSQEQTMFKAHLKALGTDVSTAASAFVRDLMRQYFVDGFFHADPHPGNLMLFRGGAIGYIDFGIIGKPAYESLHFLRFIDGATTLNMSRMAAGLVDFAEDYLMKELGEVLGDRKLKKVVKETLDFITEKLEDDLSEVAKEWHEVTGDETMPLRRRSSATTFFRVVRTAEKYFVSLPPDVIAFIRALLIIDMVCLRLDPSFNMVAAARSFFEVFPIERVRELREVRRAELEELRGTTLEGFAHSKEEKREESAWEREAGAREQFEERLYVLADRYPDLHARIKTIH